jgi:hypothetical protein
MVAFRGEVRAAEPRAGARGGVVRRGPEWWAWGSADVSLDRVHRELCGPPPFSTRSYKNIRVPVTKTETPYYDFNVLP